jgi:hypothetical protein
MNVTPFKNRELDRNKAVDLYRCLNRKGFVFSLRQNGRVVGHTDDITLANVEFKVNTAGHKRYLREKQRNVHAFARGFVTSSEQMENFRPLLYDLKEGEFKTGPHRSCVKQVSKLQIKDGKIGTSNG